MPYKDPNKRAQYARKWYEANNLRYKIQARDARVRLRDEINVYKETRGCIDCGNKYPHFALDLDHRDPSKKINNIAKMIRVDSRTNVLAEIEKCDVVCALCHRFRTHETNIQEAHKKKL